MLLNLSIFEIYKLYPLPKIECTQISILSSLETKLRSKVFKIFYTYALPTPQSFSNLTQDSIRFLSPLLNIKCYNKLIIGVTCYVSLPSQT